MRRGVHFEKRERKRIAAGDRFVMTGVHARARQPVVLPENVDRHLGEAAGLLEISRFLRESKRCQLRADRVRKTHRPRVHVLFGARVQIFIGDRDEQLTIRSEEHTSELQSPCNLVCRLLLEKKKSENKTTT